MPFDPPRTRLSTIEFRGSTRANASVAVTDLERWALASVRKHGIRRFVALMSLLAIGVSVLLVVIFWGIVDRFHDPATWGIAIVLGAIIPAMVAPPLVTFCARLIARLEAARHLLRESSVTDVLTGVANRRGFFEALDARADDRSDGVVGMVDVDRFKSLNDAHGHAVGDRALVHVADWLRQRVGPDGLVGRIGGDEFAFVAPPETSPALPARQRFDVDGVEFAVSIGTATASPALAEHALQAADVALYEVKRRHRDEPAPVVVSAP